MIVLNDFKTIMAFEDGIKDGLMGQLLGCWNKKYTYTSKKESEYYSRGYNLFFDENLLNLFKQKGERAVVEYLVVEGTKVKLKNHRIFKNHLEGSISYEEL